MKVFWQTTALLSFFVLGTIFAYAGSGGKINSGKPVPYLGDNQASADFIAQRLKKDTGVDEKHFTRLAKKLAKSLSQLNAGEQAEVWYGE